MQKFTHYLNLTLFSSLFMASASQAYIAVPPSKFQAANNTFYLSIGGGVASEHAGSWSGSDNHAGLGSPKDDKATVGVGTAAIGYGLQDYPFRFELAYNFIGVSKYKWDSIEPTIIDTDPAETGEAKIYSNIGLFNIYGDLPITENWIPFLKIGAGYGMNETKFTYTSEETGRTYASDTHGNNNFVWNAGVGINYAFSASVSMGAEVTYLYLGKAYARALVPATDYNESFAELDKLTAIAATLNLAYHF